MLFWFLSASCFVLFRLARGVPGRPRETLKIMLPPQWEHDFCKMRQCREACENAKDKDKRVPNTTTNTCLNKQAAEPPNMLQKTSILAPKMAPRAVQNHSRRPFRGRWRPKKHPRAANRDQREAKTAPRAPQERRKAIFMFFPPPGGSRF